MKSDVERTYIPVVARVSSHALRIEREYFLCKSFMQTSDPDCAHIAKLIDLVRIPSRAGDTGPLMASIFEGPGRNALRQWLDFGPGNLRWTFKPGSPFSSPTMHSDATPVSLPFFLDFAIGACEALELLHHGVRVVHGELRPDAFHYNEESGQVKLIDFGSGLRSFENGLTSSGWSALSQDLAAKFKIQYIAPEQTGRMPAEPDSRTDVYSLGVLFWTMLTAKHAFDGDTPLDVIQGVLGKRLPYLSSIRMELPDALSQIVRKMTQKQVDERYHSVSGVKHDLVTIKGLMGEGDVDALVNFKIAFQDVSSFFILPSQIFGRSDEHEKIVEVAKKLASVQQAAPERFVSTLANVTSTSASSFSERADNLEVATRSSETSSISRRESYASPALNARRPSRMYAADELTNGRAHIEPLDGKDAIDTTTSTESQRYSQRFEQASSQNHRNHQNSHARRPHKSRRRQRCEVVSILGATGLGKSSLVHSTQNEIRQFGYFGTARFDPTRKAPFEPMLQAMGSLLRQIFSESDVDTPYHNMVRANLRNIWPAVSRMLNLPETLLYADNVSTKKPLPMFNKSLQSEIAESSSTYSSQSGNLLSSSDFCHGGSNPRSTKFMSIFVEVLRVLSTQKLICLCLDGLHLADDESLELLTNIINKRLGIMILATCRSEGAIPNAVTDVLHNQNANTTVIDLRPLSEREVMDYVAAALQRPPEYVLPLAIVCLEKSNGNPFYLRQMLELCHQKSCVWYSWKTSTWDFDLDRVFAEFATDAYDDQQMNSNFITRRLQKDLPQTARSVLAWASLLGISFSFSMIQKLLSGEFDYRDQKNGVNQPACAQTSLLFTPKPEENSVEGLQIALQAYILMPGSDEDEFLFSHDRYLQAAASLRECQRIDKMHFVIVQTMMKYPDQDKRSIYDRVHHIHEAKQLLRERVKHRRAYRDILKDAAGQAIETGARPSALHYFQTAIDLLQDQPWEAEGFDVDYEETLDLYNKAIELYWFQSRLTDAQKLLDVIFANSKTSADRAPAWLTQSKIFAIGADMSMSFTALKNSLLELGLKFDAKPTWEACDKEILRLKSYMINTPIQDIVEKPISSDPNILAMGPVLVEAVSSAFWTDALLCYQLCLKMVEMHFDERGVSAQSGLGFAFMAMASIVRIDDPDFTRQLHDCSREIVSRYGDAYTVGRSLSVSGIFIAHLLSPLREHSNILEDALDNALLTGDKNLVLFAVGGLATSKIYVGDDMADVEAYCAIAPEDFVGDWTQDMRGGTFLTACRQVARALQGKTWTDAAETVMSDDSHSTQEFLVWTSSAGDSIRSQAAYKSLMLIPLFLYGHYDAVIEISQEMMPFLNRLWSLRLTRLVYFYAALALVAKYRQEPSSFDREELLETIDSYKAKIDQWTKECDANYLMWSLLIQAEAEEVREQYHTSMQCYEKAIDHAQLYDFNVELGIAFELQADFFIRRCAKRGARSTILDAMSSFSRINATGKVHQLSTKHEWIICVSTSIRSHDVGVQTSGESMSMLGRGHPRYEENIRRDTQVASANPVSERTKAWVNPTSRPGTLKMSRSDVSGLGLDILDLQSILEFNQAISSELQIDRLLLKMVEIIKESAGAQADFAGIAIQNENEWSIAASGTADGISAESRPVSELKDDVQKAILLYAMRFRENVFIQNLSLDDRFSNLHSNKSVISLPISQGTELLGILYLEGEPNSFTDRNLGILQMFCNQISISIANALLFRQIAKVSASNASMVEAQKLALAKAREAELKAKAAEAEAMENVRLKEEAAKAKNMFLANVSHELRTPLNGVIGMSELLKGSGLTKEQDGYADSIRVCADTLLTVINDILDFSKLEAGRMKLFSVPLNLKETITEVVRALSYTNLEKGLITNEELDLSPDLLVMGDPVRLHQIFMNLLSNAYKFTSSGSVTVRAQTQFENDESMRVTCSVEDTGIGITQEQASRLFKPFSQADSSTQRSYGGSGLGLSICKALIDVLNGKIWLESQLGKGTTVAFTLNFPKAKSATTPRAGPDNTARQQDPMATWSSDNLDGNDTQQSTLSFLDLSQIPKEKIRICIAEDNPINQKIAISFVNKLGFKCEAYNDGLQAVEALRRASHEKNPFHLVLMDVQMPVLDGYDATKLLRRDSDPIVRSTVVVAMTASAIRGDREKCLQAGMNNYLAKPVRAAVLKSMLEEYLNKPPKAVDAPRLEDRMETSDAPDGAKASNRPSRPPMSSRMTSRTDLSYRDKTPTQTTKPLMSVDEASGQVNGKAPGSKETASTPIPDENVPPISLNNGH